MITLGLNLGVGAGDGMPVLDGDNLGVGDGTQVSDMASDGIVGDGMQVLDMAMDGTMGFGALLTTETTTMETIMLIIMVEEVQIHQISIGTVAIQELV